MEDEGWIETLYQLETWHWGTSLKSIVYSPIECRFFFLIWFLGFFDFSWEIEQRVDYRHK